jgi:hypothetical protein
MPVGNTVGGPATRAAHRGSEDNWLPVPSELELVAEAADRLARALDDLILSRQGARDGDLADWEGTARVAWDDAFAYSQADLQAQIDDLQAIHTTLDGIREAIREHNLQVIADEPMLDLFPTLGEAGPFEAPGLRPHPEGHAR